MTEAVDIESLELAALKAWPATTISRLGDWWLRSSEGFTGRANSALPLGDPRRPLPDAVDEVVAFYRRIGQTPLIDVPLPLARSVADELARRGWCVMSTVLVQVIALKSLIDATPTGESFALDAAPSEVHLQQISEQRNGLPPSAMHVLTAVSRLAFVELWDGSSLISRGRGTVTDGRLGLFNIATATGARGRGLAGAAVGRLARWAGEFGATSAYLQVEASNSRALRLYARLGFQTHHQYTRYGLVA